jgi:hypothetical protein
MHHQQTRRKAHMSMTDLGGGVTLVLRDPGTGLRALRLGPPDSGGTRARHAEPLSLNEFPVTDPAGSQGVSDD